MTTVSQPSGRVFSVPTATLHEVVICTDRPNRGQILLLTRCPRCDRPAMHGGGRNPDQIAGMLGARVSDCGHGTYELIDPHGLCKAIAS